jgi:hypothetical protein
VPPARVADDDPPRRRDRGRRRARTSGAIDLDVRASRSAPRLAPGDVRPLPQIYLRGPYPGRVELIDDLNAAGVQTACLSNTSDEPLADDDRPVRPNYLPLDR